MSRPGGRFPSQTDAPSTFVSGSIKSTSTGVPDSIKNDLERNKNEFGIEVFPFTGE